jgi:hypothetical protein
MSSPMPLTEDCLERTVDGEAKAARIDGGKSVEQRLDPREILLGILGSASR